VKYKPSRTLPRATARSSSGWVFEAFVLGLVIAAFWWGPRAVEGYTALQWTRYHAAGPADAKLAERARQTGRWAGRTVERLAPLPPALEATRLALDLARDLASEHPDEARALCDELGPVLTRVRASRVRGFGIESRGAELDAMVSELRARAAAAPVKNGP
jgi:hypothetical protein